MAQDRREAGEGAPPHSDSGERPESVGEYLATQRRLRGISLDELCDRTKIPRRNLERLESGAFDAQPDGFARGFVRAVALDLGLDADEAVMRLVGEPSPDEIGGGPFALTGLLVRLGALAVLVIGVLLLWRVVLWAGQPGAGGEAETPIAAPDAGVTYRRDVVRGLAEDSPPPLTEPQPEREAPALAESPPGGPAATPQKLAAPSPGGAPETAEAAPAGEDVADTPAPDARAGSSAAAPAAAAPPD